MGFSVCLALAIGVWLWASSNLAAPFFPLAFAASVLFGLGVWWLCLAVLAVLRRQRPPLVVLITPIVVLPLVALGFTTLPIKARWLLSEPVFNAIVERAGPPTLRPADPDDEDEGWSELDPCPTVIGTYLVNECSQFPGGYLFWDSAGSGLIDDGGVAYLPNGIPDDLDTGWFESPEFTHLHGPWYAFASSW
ncbi:hypothetical protein GCM10022236_42100 [Microlunatus ginsengisoli]|uniref:Uncharacterized protein n=1 Tax=Microlunatus ginsengisoli TaxID=363863 RepID=A0ABP7ALG3_9ACTN